MSNPPTMSPYQEAFVAEQRRRLLAERAVVLKDIEAEEEAVRNWSNHDDAGIDQHMADDATALAEQELDASLLDNARYILREIDLALERIDDGTYGWDEECGCWIREERLQALPWALREIEGQRRIEKKFRVGHRGEYSIDADVTSL